MILSIGQWRAAAQIAALVAGLMPCAVQAQTGEAARPATKTASAAKAAKPAPKPVKAALKMPIAILQAPDTGSKPRQAVSKAVQPVIKQAVAKPPQATPMPPQAAPMPPQAAPKPPQQASKPAQAASKLTQVAGKPPQAASKPVPTVGKPSKSAATAKPARPLPATASGSTDVRALVSSFAQQHGVPETLAHHIVMRESRYNPALKGRAHFGLLQISLPTARQMGYAGAPAGLLDARTNLAYGMPYLANAWIVSGGSEARAQSLYSSGYYYEAKRKGLVKTLRTARSAPLDAQQTQDETTEPAE